MKVRQGFVSNSSSSSFIVRFERMPDSAEDTMQLLGFGYGDNVECYKYSMSAIDVAKRVFNDLQEAKKNDVDRAKEEFDSLESWDFYHREKAFLEDHFGKNSKATWQEEREYLEKHGSHLDKEREENVQRNMSEFLEDMKEGEFYVILRYADEEGDNVLEHGEIFRNLHHVRVSHH